MATRAVPLLLVCLLLPLASGATDPRTEIILDDDGHAAEVVCIHTPGGPPACLRQMDGGQPGDASNDCADPSPNVIVGGRYTGLLLPPADLQDNYALNLANNFPVVVSVASLPLDPKVVTIHALHVWAPGGGVNCITRLGTAYPGEPFSFTTTTAGVHTLQVVVHARTSIEFPPDDGPSTRNCHFMCALANLTGYSFGVGG